MFLNLVNRVAEHLPDILHDPNAIGLMSLGISVAAILVAIAIGIYQVWQGRTRRKLVYQTLSNAPIVSVNSVVADQVEFDVRVKGDLVKNAHLLIVNIKNAGKVSIHASDYFEPLIFEFDTKVLQASVLETTPPTLINPSALPTFLTLAPQSVQLPTFPFNPNDNIQISILIEGQGKLKARGRLDQGTIIELEPRKRKNVIELAITLLTVLSSLEAGILLGAEKVTFFLSLAVLLTVIAVIVIWISTAKAAIKRAKELEHKLGTSLK